MKTLSLLLFVCFLQTANATTYYFSTNSGKDSRTPAQAQNPSTPWKTLSKLNSFFSRLRPGDAVLLKRGETFYGSIHVNKSGTTGSPIVIGAYGTGEKPVITSLVKLSDWVSKGKGIWESYNSSLGETVNIVLLNNVEQEVGRYPNSDAEDKGYLTYESHVGKTSITDKQLSSKFNWKGAELVLRTRRWILDRNLIKSISGGKISYKASSRSDPYNNQGYFIQNDIKTLDKFGEWYYNPSNNKLSVYFGNKSPASYYLQATTIGNLIYCDKASNVVFENLNIKGANDRGIYIKKGSNISLKKCDIVFSGKEGVEVQYHDKFLIENCTVSNSNNNGIDLGYGGNYATIRNNKIINTAILPGSTQSGDGQGIAIFSNGNGNVIEYNEIINTGYMGIHFNGSYVSIKNNFINRFCITKDDGGGIYSHIGALKLPKGRKITGNIIINGLGAPEGSGNPTNLAVEGIYMDKNSSGVEIKDNTIASCGNNGIYFHNTHDITFNNNTIFNCTKQITFKQDPSGYLIRNNVVTNNIFFSKYSEQLNAYIKSTKDDINLFGTFNNNYYARPIDDRLVFYNQYVKKGKGIIEKFDLQSWQKKYNKDKNSKKTAKQIAPYRVNSSNGLRAANKINNGTFNNNIDAVFKTSSKTSWSNNKMLDGGYLQVTPSGKEAAVYMRIGKVTAGKKYLLKYSVRGSATSSMTIAASLRQDGSDYNRLTPLQYREVNNSRSQYEMVFSSSTNEKAATVVFDIDGKNKFYLDNIEFNEVSATVTNVDDSIRFEYNGTNAKKTIHLNDNYIDVKGKKYSKSISLQPYTSIILLNDNKDAKPSKKVPPTISITNPDYNAAYSGPATIKIAAKASDEDGSIKKVEFYNGSKLLITEHFVPYTYTWKNVPNGNYSITAKATDNDGLTTTSVIKVSVRKLNNAPVVSIKNPTGKKSFKGPATILLVANASDKNGTISKVEFYRGDTLLQTTYKKPYTYKWQNVPVGKYKIMAVATDNDNFVTASKVVSVSVIASHNKKNSNRPASKGNKSDSLIAAADTAVNVNKNAGSINSTNDALSLNLSPNPATNILNIVTRGLQQDKKMSISVLSASGVLHKTIHSSVWGQATQVDVSSLPNGSYIVRIICGEKMLNKQFIKL